MQEVFEIKNSDFQNVFHKQNVLQNVCIIRVSLVPSTLVQTGLLFPMPGRSLTTDSFPSAISLVQKYFIAAKDFQVVTLNLTL